jgi:hypothetical protein
MKMLKQLMSAVTLSILASTAPLQVSATDSTTGNLVYTTTNPAPAGTNIGQSWTGFNVVNSTGGNSTGDNGAVTGYNNSTGTFMFGYNQGTIYYTYAINQALANAGAGIQVRGYNYSWEINNNNYDNRQGSTDTLTARITTFAPNNSTILHQQYWTYNTKFDWTTFSGTVNFNNPLSPAEYGNMQLMMTGRDAGFWAGYYGPMVRNIDIRLRYGVDPCVTNPQSSPTCNGYRTYFNMTDDGYAQVNLPFAFPFYGQTFTTSYMFTNGVIGFLNPINAGGYCCDGTNLNDQRFVPGSPWNFAIYALNTDLYPGQNSQFYTERLNNGNGLRYHWDRVNEIGTNNENTFSVELRNTGYIGINYTQVNLSSWVNPLIGIAGNISQNQYSQYYFGPASALPNLAGTTLTYTGTETTDICSANPLYNPGCPGYQQAYLNQQCSANPLYSNQCPGYAQAYYNQQCSANPLYDVNCPGYATAYYDYQCSANPLYHTGCPGYDQAYFTQQCTANPLYNNQCSGYQQAYFDQQCGLNALYSNQCPNYADAYYVQQCSINPLYDSGCTGYAAAYFTQQCTANPLYNNQCPGYATAYFNQQCGISALYNQSCPGYDQAYFSQQCSLDGLYSNQCPNYAEAYAKKNILNIGSSSPSTSTPATSTATTATSDPAAAAAAVIADPVVNQAVTSTATSASPAQSATATVPLAPAPQPSTAVAARAEEKKEETKTADSKESTSTTTASSSSSDKDQPKTTRQALAERRLEAARAQAIEQGKQLAGKMGEAATIEAQIQVQAVVMAAMGFVPGFDNYGRVVLQDAIGYRPFEIYKGQRNVDNPAGRRFLTGADARHQEMVDQQYKRSD